MQTLAKPQPGQRLRLSGVDWKTYIGLLKSFGDRPGLRMTYDRGELEIMTVTFEHENFAEFLGLMVFILTEELSLPICNGGSVTLKRKIMKRGLEPDKCFWIANEVKIRGIKRIDLRKHPPPDLALEIDVTRKSLNRMSIYAKLRIPEVWRLAKNTLTFYALQANGTYAEIPNSLSFPQVKPDDLLRFLALCSSTEHNAIVAQFRTWIRQLKP